LENIQASVKHFLETSGLQNPLRDNVPGQGWYKSFLRRHPELFFNKKMNLLFIKYYIYHILFQNK